MNVGIAVFVIGWTLVILRECIQRQLASGMDAPIHFAAAELRGNSRLTRGPLHHEFTAGPNQRWAYIHPRAMLLLFAPFVPLWRWRRGVALGAFLVFSQTFLVFALWRVFDVVSMSPLLALPLVLVMWSMTDNLGLGTLNACAGWLVVLALTTGSFVDAWCIFGLAVGFRILPIVLLPAMLAVHMPGSLAAWTGAGLAMSVGVLGPNLVALMLGYGWDGPYRLLRYGRELQFGKLRNYCALHKRQAYPVMLLVPLLVFPKVAFVVSLVWFAYIVFRRNTHRGCQRHDYPDPTFGGPVFVNNWRGDNHLA